MIRHGNDNDPEMCSGPQKPKTRKMKIASLPGGKDGGSNAANFVEISSGHLW